MKMLRINNYSEIPKNFTGIIEYPTKNFIGIIEYPGRILYWLKDGNLHREDGPAYEYSDGEKYWYLEGTPYEEINLKDYIVLDYSEGKYDLMWYKLLGKDNVLEYPDISGLIRK